MEFVSSVIFIRAKINSTDYQIHGKYTVNALSTTWLKFNIYIIICQLNVHWAAGQYIGGLTHSIAGASRVVLK
jgi:hypothetical protein